MSPHPNKSLVDITEKMIERDWSVQTIYHQAENFYKSIGFEKLEEVP